MLLAITAYILIPIYTLLFVGGSDWISSNISVIGNIPGRQIAFLGLGILIGLYYRIVLGRLLGHLPRHKKESRILRLSLLFLLLSIITPYLPAQVPLPSLLHVLFASVSSALLIACLFCLIWRLSALSGDARWLLRPYRFLFPAVLCICALLLFLAGIVSSAMEVFFIIATTVMVQRLYRRFTEAFSCSRYNRSIR